MFWIQPFCDRGVLTDGDQSIQTTKTSHGPVILVIAVVVLILIGVGIYFTIKNISNSAQTPYSIVLRVLRT